MCNPIDLSIGGSGLIRSSGAQLLMASRRPVACAAVQSAVERETRARDLEVWSETCGKFFDWNDGSRELAFVRVACVVFGLLDC
jgi:hypothetical protein